MWPWSEKKRVADRNRGDVVWIAPSDRYGIVLDVIKKKREQHSHGGSGGQTWPPYYTVLIGMSKVECYTHTTGNLYWQYDLYGT